MDLATGKKTYVTEAFQSGVDDYCWAPDGKTLYFVGVWHATSMVHSTNLKGEVKQLTDGMYDYTSVAMLNDKELLTKRHSLSEADELFTVNLKKKNEVTRITQENDHLFSQLKTGKVEERWIKTVDGKDMLAWVVRSTSIRTKNTLRCCSVRAVRKVRSASSGATAGIYS